MSSLQATQWDHRVAPYIVVGFVDLINREICYTIRDLSMQLNRFLQEPRRHRQTFVAKASTIAYYLGLTFRAAVPLQAQRRARHDAVCGMATFPVACTGMLTSLRAQYLPHPSLALTRC